jgi:hypothetical protein
MGNGGHIMRKEAKGRKGESASEGEERAGRQHRPHASLAATVIARRRPLCSASSPGPPRTSRRPLRRRWEFQNAAERAGSTKEEAVASRLPPSFHPLHPSLTPSQIFHLARSVFLNGQRAMFASAGIHYPRFTPGQWDDVLLKVKADGYNMVQTYFFANAHQPKTTTWPWNMEGPNDLRLFITKAANAGLFVNLRIGPYVCAEWNAGGVSP